MDNKVIVFPKSYKGSSPPSVEQVRENLRAHQIEMVEEITDEAVAAMLTVTSSVGIQINNQFDIGLVLESVRSMLMRDAGMDNPLQEIADKMVVVTNEKGQQVCANGHILGTDLVDD